MLSTRARRKTSPGPAPSVVARRRGEQHHEEGQRDAVVEPALDVESLPHRRRDPGVGDRRLPERGVGRRQDDGDERQLPDATGRAAGPTRRASRAPSSGAGRAPSSRSGSASSRRSRDQRTVLASVKRTATSANSNRSPHGLGVAREVEQVQPDRPAGQPAATRSIGPDTGVGASRRETRATAPTDPAAAAAAQALTGCTAARPPGHRPACPPRRAHPGEMRAAGQCRNALSAISPAPTRLTTAARVSARTTPAPENRAAQ